jgi:heme/copper-type cytochrome/quinol oxidase subunit 4
MYDPAMSKSPKQIVHKEQKQASFQSYLVVSSEKSALILLPFLTVALHESGTRKTRYWSVAVYNKIIQSMQFDCSIRTSGG